MLTTTYIVVQMNLDVLIIRVEQLFLRFSLNGSELLFHIVPRRRDVPESDGGGVAERGEGEGQLDVAVYQEGRWDCGFSAVGARPSRLALAPQPPWRPVAPAGPGRKNGKCIDDSKP